MQTLPKRKLTKSTAKQHKWISTRKKTRGFSKRRGKEFVALFLSIKDGISALKASASCVQENCVQVHAHNDGKEAYHSYVFNADTVIFDCDNSATGHICNHLDLYLDPPVQKSGNGRGLLTVNEFSNG